MLVTVAVTMVVIMALATAALMLFIMGMTLAATAFVTIIVAVTTTALVVIIMTVTTAAPFVSVMMVVLTMNMAMSYLFGRSRAHIAYCNGETQIHPGQWMVGINLDKLFTHLNHSHRTMTVVRVSHEGITFGDFHTVKQFTRYALHQIFIIFAVGIGSIHIQLKAIANRAVIERLFQTWNQKTGTVQINQRLAAFGGVQYISRLVKYGVVEGYNAQMANFHVRFPKLVPQDKQRRN